MRGDVGDLTKRGAIILFSLAGTEIATTLTSIVIDRLVRVREFGLCTLILNLQSSIHVLASLRIATTLWKYDAGLERTDSDVETELTKTGFESTLILSGLPA